MLKILMVVVSLANPSQMEFMASVEQFASPLLCEAQRPIDAAKAEGLYDGKAAIATRCVPTEVADYMRNKFSTPGDQ